MASAALGIGATFGGTASAATISTAPAGYTPQVIGQTTGSSFTFDVSGSGLGRVQLTGKEGFTIDQPDSKFNGKSKPGSIDASTLGDNNSEAQIYTANGQVAAYAQPSIPVGGALFGGAPLATGMASNFSDVARFGIVAYRARNNGVPQGDFLYGYFKATFANQAATVLDYGRIVADAPVSNVPEPSAWAMLTLGVGGIGSVLRGSRNAKRRRGVAVAA